MISKNTLLLLNLTRDYIKQVSSEETLEDFIKDNDSDIDWKDICAMAAQNGALPFVYHQIKNFNNKYNITPNVLISLKNHIIYRSSRQIKANECLGTVIDAFNNAGIQFMILKGVVMAELYPHPEYRYSCDADIHLAPEYLEAAQKILVELSYELLHPDTQKYDYAYVLENLYAIELHTKLFEDFYDKHKEVLDKYEIDSISHTIKYNILEREILSLQCNEILIHLLCHMAKHFVGSGITLRYLMDIAICVNSYSKQLDFGYIMSFFKNMKIDEFVINIFFLCNKYFNMNNIVRIEYENIQEKVVDELIYDTLEQTVQNESDITRTLSFFAYYKDDRNIVKDVMFPGKKRIINKYLYAKKNKLLLPIAWCHRAFVFLQKILKTPRYLASLKNSRRRISLLKKLGLLCI